MPGSPTHMASARAQDRDDVAAVREALRIAQPTLDPKRLNFMKPQNNRMTRAPWCVGRGEEPDRTNPVAPEPQQHQATTPRKAPNHPGNPTSTVAEESAHRIP